LPDVSGRFNYLFLNVERTINGATVNYIEAMMQNVQVSKMFGGGNERLDRPRQGMDSAFTIMNYTLGAGKGDVPHLRGETVSVVTKGVWEGDKVVLNSAGTNYVVVNDLTAVADDVVVGLPYVGKLKGTITEQGSRIGNAHGNLKRSNRATLRLYRSKRFKIGATDALNETVSLNAASSVDLYTGVKQLQIKGNPELDSSFYIETVGPYPFAVLSLALEGLTSEG